MDPSLCRHRRYAARHDLRMQRQRHATLVQRLNMPARRRAQARLQTLLLVVRRQYRHKPHRYGQDIGLRTVRFVSTPACRTADRLVADGLVAAGYSDE